MFPLILLLNFHVIENVKFEVDPEHRGCLPFTSKTHLVSDCANGTQNFRLENPLRSTGLPFPIRLEETGNISRKTWS